LNILILCLTSVLHANTVSILLRLFCLLFAADLMLLGWGLNSYDFCSSNHVDAAILCVPKTAAGEAAEKLYSAGIRNFWNFSRYDILLRHDDVIVEDLSISESLMVLCYRISESRD